MPAIQSKTDQVRDLLQAGDHKQAMKIAATFRLLSKSDRATIQQAWSAISNPQFYLSINRKPDEMFAAGVVVLHRLYGN